MGIFKAYDIRGLVPEQLDVALAKKIGNAAVKILGSKSMIVGRDMRPSGVDMAAAFIEGATDAGCDCIDIGMTSTPGLYFYTGHSKACAGVMITASHNPAGYNGFKFCREDAVPVSGETGIYEMEKLTLDDSEYVVAETKGSVSAKDTLVEYTEHLKKFANDLKPMKVAIDTGNGVMGAFLPTTLADIPLDVTPMYYEPDGTFPNHEANPLEAENMADLQAKVKEIGADLGIAFDGDGDRAMFVDEKGELISADLISVLIAEDILAEEPGATITYDLRSSKAVPERIVKLGGVPLLSRVGHSFIKAQMREHKAAYGGELSGHYYFRDNYYSDSAEIAMFRVLKIVAKEGKAISELIAPLKKYFATGEINFDVDDKDAAQARLKEAFKDGDVKELDGVSVYFSDWWFNVRPSNTEPKLRLNLEADTAQVRDEKYKAVVEIIKGN